MSYETTMQTQNQEDPKGSAVNLQIAIVSLVLLSLIFTVALWQKKREMQHKDTNLDDDTINNVEERLPCQSKINLTKSISFRTANNLKGVKGIVTEEEMERMVQKEIEIEIDVR